MVAERDLTLPDGRTLHIYDGGSAGDDRLAVAWLHGTPNIGAPPAPLFGASDHLGIRWVSYDRPGYGGSTPLSGRNVASAAGDVEALVDAVGVERFAVFGHSSGAACALACAALLPARVVAAVSVSGLAPLGAAGLDWFGGMSPAGVASLRAAVDGRAVKQQHEAAATAEDPGFIPADMEALEGPWAWFLDVVRPAVASGPGGLIDDDLATVAPWGFDPADIEVPVLIVHGDADRVVPSSHGRWLAATVPTAQVWIRPSDGHISVLAEAPAALEWLRQHAGP